MEKTTIDSLEIYTEKELAAKLLISQWTVRLWRIQAGLPHFRTAGRIFYRLESVAQWMDAEEDRNVELYRLEVANQQKLKRIAQ